jgi:hypothetical protein
LIVAVASEPGLIGVVSDLKLRARRLAAGVGFGVGFGVGLGIGFTVATGAGVGVEAEVVGPAVGSAATAGGTPVAERADPGGLGFVAVCGPPDDPMPIAPTTTTAATRIVIFCSREACRQALPSQPMKPPSAR